MTALRPLVLTIVLLVSATAATLAAERSVDKRAIDFAVNNGLAAMYHEIGHLFIDQYELPVLGARTEDAADTIATLLLLAEETPQADAVLRDTVDGWLLDNPRLDRGGFERWEFYGRYLLDIQRAYGIVCLMVGKDFDKYRDVARTVSMDTERAHECATDYDLAERSLRKVLIGHEKVGARAGPGVVVTYDEAGGSLRDVAEYVRASTLLEAAAKRIEDGFMLDRVVKFRALSCDEANAFYVEDLNEIQFCYEYAAYFYDLKAKALQSAAEPGDKGDSKN
ncbi:MAG: hypothetical protein JWR75_1824 [Devosia sp.]|nr:hypothetical protein [Devosia sp.]